MFEDQKIRAIIALLSVGALIVGFFMSLISSEVYVPIALIAIQHYFQKDRENALQSKIDDQDKEFKALATGKAQIVTLS